MAFASAVNTSSIIDETYKEVKVDALPRSAHVDGSARGVPFVNLASRSFRDVLVVAPSSSSFIPRSGVLKEFVMWRETVSLGPSDLPTR